MKKIRLNAVITSIRSKVDKSLGLTIGTPELSVEEKAEIMRLQGVNLIAFFIPTDEPNAPEFKINKELETKTPGQRLRNTLYVWWEQQGANGDFNEFYRDSMENIIDSVKRRLD